MRKSLIGLLASFSLGATALAGQTPEEQNPGAAKGDKGRQEMNPGESRQAQGTTAAPSKSGSPPSNESSGSNQGESSQFGRADDRAASSLDTHHDLAKNEVTGKIVRTDGNTVWIDHMGAVIPLKIEPNTRFESAGITRPKDLKEGQEIRASFTVQNKTTNVADSIWLEGATATGTRPSSSATDTHRSATSPKRSVTPPEDRGTSPGAHPNGVK